MAHKKKDAEASPEPIILEPTAGDRAHWAAQAKHKKVSEDGTTVTLSFRGKSITMPVEQFEETAKRMQQDGTASEDADAPPTFEPVSVMGAIHVTVAVRDRDLLKGALGIASSEAAKAISARRNLGLGPDAQLEGIHATARSLATIADKQEALDDGTLRFELNAASAPVLRIALWLWMRWAQHLDEKAQEKGLPTSAVRGIKVAEALADSILDQLGLL